MLLQVYSYVILRLCYPVATPSSMSTPQHQIKQQTRRLVWFDLFSEKLSTRYYKHCTAVHGFTTNWLRSIRSNQSITTPFTETLHSTACCACYIQKTMQYSSISITLYVFHSHTRPSASIISYTEYCSMECDRSCFEKEKRLRGCGILCNLMRTV